MKQDMKKNEVRAFKIKGDAINELVWELLNKVGEELLDLPESSESIFHMYWNKEKDELIFGAVEFENPRPLDFKAIDKYIDNKIGITTDTLFASGAKQKYKVFNLNDITEE